MKCQILVVLLILIAAAVIGGCTGQPPASAPPPSSAIAAAPVTQSPGPAPVPSEIAGDWTLTTMGIQGGTQILMPLSDITLTFDPDGRLYGYDGCNNYDAAVRFTGDTTSHGSGMNLGPVGRTANSCASLADQEQMYFQILRQTSAYDIDSTQLTLTAETGDVLIYERPSALTTTIPPPY